VATVSPMLLIFVQVKYVSLNRSTAPSVLLMGVPTILTEGDIEERKLMVQWWADYLDANREKHVGAFGFGR